MRLRMAGRAIHGSTKAGLGPELGFPHLAIEITFSLCFSSLCPPPSPSSMATQVPILPLTFLGAMGLRANFLAFLRLTFFICKVADLVLTHDKYQRSSAWRAERMQQGPALIPPLPAIAAFFPALSPPAPLATCPGPQWGFCAPPHTLGPSFPVGKIRCHALRSPRRWHILSILHILEAQK